jgi:hypothetical protein
MLTQFQDRHFFKAFVTAIGEQLQELECVFIDLQILRTLDYAQEKQLDKLGELLGEGRGGRSDLDYRAALKARIRVHRCYSTAEEVLAVLQAIEDRDYKIGDLGYAHFLVDAGNQSDYSVSLNVISGILQTAKGGGILVDLEYALIDEDYAFTTATGDASETSADKGTADDAQTSGGHLADIL